MNNTDDIINLLLLINERPGIYIGCKSLIRLKSFIDGYFFTMYHYNIDFNREIYDKFNSWLEEKYNVKMTVRWDYYLIENTNDEEKAFDLFFEELDLFLKTLVQ